MRSRKTLSQCVLVLAAVASAASSDTLDALREETSGGQIELTDTQPGAAFFVEITSDEGAYPGDDSIIETLTINAVFSGTSSASEPVPSVTMFRSDYMDGPPMALVEDRGRFTSSPIAESPGRTNLVMEDVSSRSCDDPPCTRTVIVRFQKVGTGVIAGSWSVTDIIEWVPEGDDSDVGPSVDSTTSILITEVK